MSKYRIIFEIDEKSVSKASVKRVFQKYDSRKWKDVSISDCDSVSAYVVYSRVSKGAGCFNGDRDVIAEVTVMLLRAILDGIHEDLGTDPEVAADRLEKDYADLIKGTAGRFMQYAEQDNNVLVASMVRHFIATFDYTMLAEMLISEAREAKTEYGRRVEAFLNGVKFRNPGKGSEFESKKKPRKKTEKKS